MRAQYEHIGGCDCSGCRTLRDTGADDGEIVRRLSDLYDVRFKAVPRAVMDDYLDKVHSQKLAATDLHEDLWREHFSRLRQFAEAGYGKRFVAPGGLDEWAMFQKMQRNAARFAACKQQAMTADLRRFLYDADGKKRSLGDFKDSVKATLRRHNRYTKVELDAANKAASAVEEWKEIRERAYLYPHLRYETVGDSRVRDEHRALDGAVYRWDDPFWKTWYPPNGWSCRCIAVQTDAPLDERAPGTQPAKGFRHNPGETGELFSPDHPYFNNLDKADLDRVVQQGERFHARLSKSEVKEWSGENYVAKDRKFQVPGLPGDLELSGSKIRSVLHHQHPDATAKNELLYVLQAALAKSTRLAVKPNTDPDKNQTVQWFYYLLKVGELEFVFNIEEMVASDGIGSRFVLYAISGNRDLDF